MLIIERVFSILVSGSYKGLSKKKGLREYYQGYATLQFTVYKNKKI
jgi:hypothetical protein